MFGGQRQRRAAKRVKPGDGRSLQRFRRWQVPGRALFHLLVTDDDGHRAVYAVDVRHRQNQQSGDTRALLHRRVGALSLTMLVTSSIAAVADDLARSVVP